MSEASKRRRARKKQKVRNNKLKATIKWRRFIRGRGQRP